MAQPGLRCYVPQLVAGGDADESGASVHHLTPRIGFRPWQSHLDLLGGAVQLGVGEGESSVLGGDTEHLHDSHLS